MTPQQREGTLLATGLLTWGREERIGDRYGAVAIQVGGELPDGTIDSYLGEREPGTYAWFEDAPVGARGRLVAEVVEARTSGHVGDIFHGFFPETPEVGERIVLGEGTLFVERESYFGHTVGLSPEDGRVTFWLDPPSLYRAHEQIVRLIFEEAS